MIIIYGRTEPKCNFCTQAKNLAKKAGLEYEFLDYSSGQWSQEELFHLYGKRAETVPFVVVDGKHIGGAKELYHYLKEK